MSPEEYRETGWSVRAPATHVLSVADKHGADPGVEVRRHPELELSLRPHLVGLVDEVRVGLWREPDRAAWSQMSCYETDALLTLINASGRFELEKAKISAAERGAGGD